MLHEYENTRSTHLNGQIVDIYTTLTFVILLNRLPTHFICVKIQCVFIDAKGKSKLSFYLLDSTFYCVKDEYTQT